MSSIQLKSFIKHINLSSRIFHLTIENTYTAGIEMILSLLPNLRSLNLGFIKRDLDFEIIFNNLKALSSVHLNFENRYSVPSNVLNQLASITSNC